MTRVYLGPRDRVKSCSFGYPAIPMNRINKKQKISQATQSASYSAILQHEGLSYIAAIACIKASGIPSLAGKGMKYLNNLSNIINSNMECSMEDLMIKWMCTTGEMRNHSAVACHTDGNKSCHYEIYSLFQRVQTEYRNGYLYLPLDNLCIEIQPTKQILFSNFRNTPHVPDTTRNTHNFSRVHGPKP